jgi:hypothetical protein
MYLVDLGARSMFLVDLDFTELGRLAEKKLGAELFLRCGAACSSAKYPLSRSEILSVLHST